MTIFALLVALTVPAMRTWVANTRVRAAADSMQNGVRLAQTEALRRSRQVVFALTSSTTPQTLGFTASATGTNWAVQTIPAMLDGSDPAAIVGSGSLAPAGTLTISSGPAAICFNSVGRLVAQANTNVTGATCTTPTTTVNNAPTVVYQFTTAGADRPLRLQISLGGQMHLCDPSQTLAASNPYGC